MMDFCCSSSTSKQTKGESRNPLKIGEINRVNSGVMAQAEASRQAEQEKESG